MASYDVDMAGTTTMPQIHRVQIDTESEDEMIDDDSTDESSMDENHTVPRGLMARGLPTGLCYDERMRYHAEVSALSAEAVHPEDPRRIYYIFKELCEAGLVVAKGYDVMVDQPLLRIDAREATEEEILYVHTKPHYNFVRKTADLIDLSESATMDSIYFNKLSYFSGKLSAGGAIETCKAVMDGRVKNAIAVIRPPGHHAEPDATMGFCLFNNTCIASRVCQNDYGGDCRKILILDWDVHHGNGCQQAFWKDPNILYISLHVHQGGKFYPSGPEGGMDRCGGGAGEGYNVNIPWDHKGMGDGDYMYAFQHVVMPIACSFNPDLVIVSAGFDAAAGDELGGCNVTPACYAHMTHMLMSLAKGRVAVCLEGGYNFRAISRSALAVTRTLMGEPPDRLEPTSATDSAVRVIEQVKLTQSKFWKCMYPKAPTSGIYEGERLHDVIRKYQAQHLYDTYKLTELCIFRPKISKSFEKQVLASISYEKKKRLMVLFHDPPDLLSANDPLIAQQKPQDTWLLDATQSYIEFAVQSKMGVIDINIPGMITISADPNVDEQEVYRDKQIAYNSHITDVARIEAEKLATYVWENYIEPHEFPGGIWLVGAGSAFHTVAKLLTDNDRAYGRIRGVVAFICDTNLVPINSASNGHYFRDRSMIYLAQHNQEWRKTEQRGKQLSKRYGNVIKSKEMILNSMMCLHREEVFQFIASTSDRAAMDEDSDEDEDEDEDVLRPYPRPPSRDKLLSSPPQERPSSAAAATAFTSAALHNVVGSSRGPSGTLSPGSNQPPPTSTNLRSPPSNRDGLGALSPNPSTTRNADLSKGLYRE